MNEPKKWRDGYEILEPDPATALGCEIIALIKAIGLTNYFVCSTMAVLTHLDAIAKEEFRAGRLTLDRLNAIQSRVEQLCEVTESFAPGWEEVVKNWGDNFDEEAFVGHITREHSNGH